MRAGWLFMVVMLLADGVSAADNFVTGSGMRVTLSHRNSDYTSIKSSLRNIDRTVLRLLRKQPGDSGIVELHVNFSPPPTNHIKVALHGNQSVVTLPEDYNLWKNDFEIQRRLLAAVYLTKCGYSLRKEADLKKVPYWIQTATYEYVLRRQTFENDIMELNSYPEIHAVAVAGGEIIPDDIITANIRIDDGDTFLIYCAAAEFLLTNCAAVSLGNDRIIENIINAAVRGGKSDVDIFYQEAGMQLMRKLQFEDRQEKTKVNREKLRQWFWNSLRFKAVNYFYPLPEENLDRDFKALCGPLEYKKKQSDGSAATATCNLSQLWDVWGEITNRKEVINEIRKKLVPLVQASPSDFISVLLRMDKLLLTLPLDEENYQNFKEDHENFNFPHQIEAIVKSFDELISERRKLNSRLQAAEAKYLSPDERFFYEFRALQQHEKNNRAMWPEQNKMLDRLEKEYFTE